MAKKMNREQWLEAAVAKLAPSFEAIGSKVPADVRVSVGWPGGRGKKNTVIGQCWSSKAAKDGSRHIFISPVLEDPAIVLATLVHELVHAVDDCESGHKGGFAKMARRLGLEGKLTATVAGPALAEDLALIARKLGDYPHAALVPVMAGGKQTTRMLKVECKTTGYKVRMTRSWIDQLGTPKCPCCGKEMEEA